jgi:hypothetical protein
MPFPRSSGRNLRQGAENVQKYLEIADSRGLSRDRAIIEEAIAEEQNPKELRFPPPFRRVRLYYLHIR